MVTPLVISTSVVVRTSSIWVQVQAETWVGCARAKTEFKCPWVHHKTWTQDRLNVNSDICIIYNTKQEQCSFEEIRNEAIAVQKHITAHLIWQKSTWMFHHATRKISPGQMKHGGEHQNLIPRVKYKGGTIIVWVALLLHDLDSLPSLTEKWIPMFIRTFWWITWFVCQSQLNGCWVIQQDNDIGVIQQQKSFNRRKYSFWSSSESWPQPDWEGLAWPQESNSHQTSQEYCRAGTKFCLEEWCKIPPDHWAGLICNCRKLWFLWLCLYKD